MEKEVSLSVARELFETETGRRLPPRTMQSYIKKFNLQRPEAFGGRTKIISIETVRKLCLIRYLYNLGKSTPEIKKYFKSGGAK